MVQDKVSITIFSSNSALEEAAGNLRLPTPLAIELLVTSQFSEEACGGTDILVYDLPLPLSPKRLRSLCRVQTVICLSAPKEYLDSLDEDELSAADDWWEQPSGKKMISLRLSRAVSQFWQRKECHRYRTYLDTAINSIPDLVWFKDLSGIHMKVNDAFCKTVGKTMDDVVGQGHCYIWNVSHDDPDSGELACKQSEDIVIRERKTCQFTEKVKSKHGMRQFKTYKTPLLDEDGAIIGTVGIGHDITDLENLGTELEIFLQSMPFAILLCNEKGVIINMNEQLENYFDTRREQILGQSYHDWIESVFAEPKFVNTEGFVEAEVLGSFPARILEIHEAPIHDVFNNIAGQVCIYRDVTTERKLEQQILHNSNTDFLTGLYNRRCFYQYIHNNRGDKPISLLYVDLDCFKKINDTYGHKLGDQALIMTAGVLRECFKNEFIARIGGDEFLIALLGDWRMEELTGHAQNLIDCLGQAFRNFPPLGTLSASVGIAQTTDSNKDIDQLIQESDTALYEAKQRGKSQYYVYRREENEKNDR